MTTAPVPPVIPSFPRGSGLGASPARRRRSPLPLPAAAPASVPVSEVVYALSAVDKSGRVADRGIVRSMAWEPGTRLDIRVRSGLIVACVAPDGICAVDGRGYVVLPLAARRWCRLRAGDRVLLVAHHVTGVLVAHPLPVLDRLLAPVLSTVIGGEAP
jgi:hypothetical protein